MPETTATPIQPTAIDPQPRPLTDFQETVCNLAADLIVNGGLPSDVSNLLRATIGHSLHLQFPEFDAYHPKRITGDLPAWLQRISCHWPAKTDPVHELPKTVSEMARANVRGSLRKRFEDFLGNARVHELYLLDNVLGDFDSRGAGPDADTAESPFAEAFMLALDSDDTYVKVPSDRVEAVEQFLKTMDGIPDVDATATVGRPKLLAFPSRPPSPEVPNAS